MNKRKYTHVSEYEAIILSMRQNGCTLRTPLQKITLTGGIEQLFRLD